MSALLEKKNWGEGTKMNRIIITGVAGFLGSYLANELLEDGYQVVGVDNISTGNLNNINKLTRHHHFTFLETDISCDKLLNHPELIDIDGIYHLASPASPKWYQEAPFETISVNTIGTKNMLELANRNNAKLLFSSTSEIYGDPEVHPQSETYKGNVNTWGPRACYDESKRLGEVYCYLHHTLLGTKVTVARIFNTYAEGLQPNDGRVISNFIMQALKGEDLTVYGDGSQTRTFCYVVDTISGLRKMMESEETNGEIFNIGHPIEYTILEVAELVKRLTNSSSKIVFKDLLEDDPQVRCPDISKAMRMLNWKPQVELTEGLHRTIEEYKKQI